ncbi:MAG: flagellin [Desulfobulbaceae bacterium]|nr:MAG: flagellin [Desulfobulbaceae bacterium]
MSIVVNTNVAALNAQRNLIDTGQQLNQSLQRLSSGLRINSARDDAAGLAISDRMGAQVRGLNQAVRNANDAISLAQTAEGALQESTTILQRIRKLSIQSASDTNTAANRLALQAEVGQLQRELTRIAEQTTFNRQVLLDGSFSARRLHIGSDSGQTIDMSITAARAADMGEARASSRANIGGFTPTATAADPNEVVAQNLRVAGSLGTVSGLAVAANASAFTIAATINGASATTGVTATATNSITLSSVGSGTVTFGLQSRSAGTTVGTAVNISASIATTSDLTTLAAAINAETARTGISASLGTNRAMLQLRNSTGHDIVIVDYSHTGTDRSLTVSGAVAGTATLSGVNDSIAVGGQLALRADASFSVTTTVPTTVFTAATTVSALRSVDAIDVSSQAGANAAIGVVDGALALIGSIRGDLGAIQNRFTSTIANLMSVSENISAAQSRILDADFAVETANLTRAQILQQAGLAMLSQANQAPQAALTLIQG